eukprot:Hpha_TRINITY_DN16607_c2_g4::TRINITY_DN16607_c2_g4_i1::g.182900::m.182900
MGAVESSAAGAGRSPLTTAVFFFGEAVSNICKHSDAEYQEWQELQLREAAEAAEAVGEVSSGEEWGSDEMLTPRGSVVAGTKSYAASSVGGRHSPRTNPFCTPCSTPGLSFALPPELSLGDGPLPGMYSGCGAAAGLKVTVGLEVLPQGGAFHAHVKSLTRWTVWDVPFETESTASRTDMQQLQTGPEMMRGLQGTVVQKAELWYDPTMRMVRLVLTIRLSSWLPTIPITTDCTLDNDVWPRDEILASAPPRG